MATTTTVFHEGETAVQERAGVRAVAERLGAGMIEPVLDAQFAGFLRRQPFVVVASHTAGGQVWASALTGQPGFATAIAPEHLVVRADIPAQDPLAAALAEGPAPVGMLVIEPVTRGRIRINGVARRTPHGLELEPAEVFGNCPKYIQRRVPAALAPTEDTSGARVGSRLDEGQSAFVGAADTFFIASRHIDRGADASHRGGRPGFVRVGEDGRRLTFPDYSGNNMFQTLGNLSVNPHAGLLFIDWAGGRTLQLSGHAEVIWDEARIGTWPGAQRLVDLEIEAVIDRPGGSALRWEFIEAHRLNPPLPEG
ncbi:MAG TPA: pyridoxamine 5'-phosphate oxidase family protein [Solirubrobacteraceae bacterium]|jgi:hypothetical protein